VSVESLASIVAFVLPGYGGMRLYEFFVRTKKRNDFERLATSLTLSLASYVAVAGLLLGVTATVRRYGIPCAELEIPTSVNLGDWGDWIFVALLFITASLLGLGFSCVARIRSLRLWLREGGLDYSPYPNVWNEMWHCEERAPWAVVKLRDGTSYYGQVHKYSNDPDQDLKELWLFPVATQPEHAYQESEVIDGISVYIPGDDIAAVEAFRVPDE